MARLHQKGFFVGPWVSLNPMLTNQRDCENRMAIMASPSKTDFGYSTFLWCKGPWRSTYRLTLMASVVGHAQYCKIATPIFSRNPTVDLVSNVVLTGRFGEASSWKSDFSMPRPFQVTKMAVDPPTHRSFTCYSLLKPACPSLQSLRIWVWRPRVHQKKGRTSPEGILCWPMSFSKESHGWFG